MAEKNIVFVNYRRADSDADAQWLAREIEAAFGEGQVFIDVEGIRGGDRFAERIESVIHRSRVMISVVGPNWYDVVVKEGGQRRIENSEDWVRIEIRRALAECIPIIPVLVGGLTREVFSQWKLPADIAQFSQFNAMAIDPNTRRSGQSDVIKRLDDFGMVRSTRLLRAPFCPLPAAEARTPSSLLLPVHRAVPLFGRDDELEEATSWCHNSRVIDLRVYTGPGGVGKTRFAAELCGRLSEEGWITGFLDDDADVKTADYLPILSSGRSTLLIIDDAESQPGLVEQLIKLAVQRQSLISAFAGPVRMIFLARRAGDWWEQIKRRLKDNAREFIERICHSSSDITKPSVTSDSHNDTAVVQMKPLADTPERRPSAFEQAANAFGMHLGRTCNVSAPDLKEGHFGNILYVHLAARAAIEGVALTDANALLKYCVDRERLFWYEKACALRPPLLLDDWLMDEAMAAVVTMGPACSELDYILSLTEIPADARTSLRRMITELYGPENSDQPQMAACVPILGVQPDLLGEALVTEVLQRQPPPLKRWLVGISNERHLERCFTVLSRIAQRYHPQGEAERWIDSLLAKVVTLITDLVKSAGVEPIFREPPLSDKMVTELLRRWVAMRSAVRRWLMKTVPYWGDAEMRVLNTLLQLEDSLSSLCGIQPPLHPVSLLKSRDEDPFFDRWMAQERERVGLKKEEVYELATRLPRIDVLARVDGELEIAERAVFATQILVPEAEYQVIDQPYIDIAMAPLERFLDAMQLLMRILQERPATERVDRIATTIIIS